MIKHKEYFTLMEIFQNIYIMENYLGKGVLV